MKLLFNIICWILFVSCSFCAAAEAVSGKSVRLNRVLGEHMVFQQKQPVRVWGFAAPREKITGGFAGQHAETVADEAGNWQLSFKPEPAGGPYTLRVEGEGENNRIQLNDVMVGELWFCSGQSNMEMNLANCRDGMEETANAGYPQLRVLLVDKVAAGEPVAEPFICQEWSRCSPETAGSVSGAAFFFGRKLLKELDIPVGLIVSSWGGSRIESWMPAAPVSGNSSGKEALEALRAGHERRMESLRACYALESDRAALSALARDAVDDDGYRTVQVPQSFSGTGIWIMRRRIQIPAEWCGRDLALELGAVDETDVTFFNGSFIDARGSLKEKLTKFWNCPRHYKVPGKLVKPGENVIDMAVGNLEGGMGLIGLGAMRIFPQDAPQEGIRLEGEWKCRPLVTVPAVPGAEDGIPYNSMVHPFFPLPVAGVIWYQGEANVDDPGKYAADFAAMIEDWRSGWGRALPFYYVQLPNFAHGGGKWASFREMQRLCASEISGVGMAVTVDVGDSGNIHPANKQAVGDRLARLALKNTYGRSGTVAAGPEFLRAEKAGNRMIVHFRKSASPLRPSADLAGFEVAGADGVFRPARAATVNDTVVVQSEAVAAPEYVRYAWSDDPEVSLFNQEGLPGTPFSSLNRKWQGFAGFVP